MKTMLFEGPRVDVLIKEVLYEVQSLKTNRKSLLVSSIHEFWLDQLAVEPVGAFLRCGRWMLHVPARILHKRLHRYPHIMCFRCETAPERVHLRSSVRSGSRRKFLANPASEEARSFVPKRNHLYLLCGSDVPDTVNQCDHQYFLLLLWPLRVQILQYSTEISHQDNHLRVKIRSAPLDASPHRSTSFSTHVAPHSPSFALRTLLCFSSKSSL